MRQLEKEYKYSRYRYKVDNLESSTCRFVHILVNDEYTYEEFMDQALRPNIYQREMVYVPVVPKGTQRVTLENEYYRLYLQ